MLYQSKNPHGGDIYSRRILLDFSANTTPYGTPQGILDAVQNALPQMHRYPDPCCRKLTEAISIHENIPQDFILCGNGAADLIYSYCEAVKPARALELAPTFAEYSLGLARTGCQIFRHELKQEQGFSLTEDFLGTLQAVKTDVIFLCNPNNPTGKTIPSDLLSKILDFCRQTHTRLFLDECFLDLTDGEKSMKDRLALYPELFILKAFTKSYGMAGIRLGYGLCADSALLSRMAETTQPWNVSSLAQAAGVAALKETAFLEQTKDLIRTQRKWLKEQLENLGFWVSDSTANYLLFQADPQLGRKLEERKIAIRNCDNYHGLTSGWYRIAVKLPEENHALIDAIKEIYSK